MSTQYTLLHGDCLALMDNIPDDSIDESYYKIAQRRIADAAAQERLF